MLNNMNYENSENPFVELDEQEVFLHTLHHDYRGGYIVRMSIDNDGNYRSYANKSIKEIKCYNSKNNVYVSLNTFKNHNRAATNVHSINCIYYDLDTHNGTDKHIKLCIENTLKAIKNEFEADTLPRPTMITNTGRGLGLFYVLENSIANTSKTQKSIRFWKYIYTSMAEKIKNVLKKHPNTCELDTTSIADRSRIVRMPLTYNVNAKKVCYLEQINTSSNGDTLYYNLSDLSKYCEDYKVYDSKKDNEIRAAIKKNNIISLEAYKKPFLSRRMQKLEILQSISNDKCTNKRREYMCFVYYNAAKQINLKNASNLLYLFNEGFNEPLSLDELKHTMKSVDTNKAEYGNYEGYYKLTDKTIIEKLDLDEEEIKATGFGVSYRKIVREKKKEENRIKKAKRNDLIVKMILTDLNVTYKEIAEKVGVSEKTVKRVAKEYGVGRYNSSVASENNNNVIDYINNENENEVIEESTENEAIIFLNEQKGHFVSESLNGVLTNPSGGIIEYGNTELLSNFIGDSCLVSSDPDCNVGQLRFCFSGELVKIRNG